MKRLLCCIMALTMIGSATAFAAEPVDNSAIAEKALSEVTALYEDLYTITNAEAEVQNSTYDDMGNIIVDVVVSFDRTLKATCAEDMPYIQGLEIALTELTDPDEISAASAYIDAKKADLEDNYIGVAQDTYIELQVTVPIATARSNAAQAIGIDNIEYVGMNENVPAKELAPDSNQAMMESGQAAILNITERMATPSTRASTINSVIKNYDRVRARDYARDWSCTNGSLYDHATCHNPEYTFYASNDCTNFVSQCLVYGGLPTDSKWKPYTEPWKTTGNAGNGIRQYLTNNGLFFHSTNEKEAFAGSIINWLNSDGTNAGHVGLVDQNDTAKTSHHPITKRRTRIVDVDAANPVYIGISSRPVRSDFFEQGGHTFTLVLLIPFFPATLAGDIAPNIRSVFDGGQTLTIDQAV